MKVAICDDEKSMGEILQEKINEKSNPPAMLGRME